MSSSFLSTTITQTTTTHTATTTTTTTDLLRGRSIQLPGTQSEEYCCARLDWREGFVRRFSRTEHSARSRRLRCSIDRLICAIASASPTASQSFIYYDDSRQASTQRRDRSMCADRRAVFNSARTERTKWTEIKWTELHWHIAVQFSSVQFCRFAQVFMRRAEVGKILSLTDFQGA